MIIEYALHDLTENDQETKQQLQKVINFPVNSLSVYSPHLKLAKSVVSEARYPIMLNAMLGYPYGQTDSETRQKMVKNAIDLGANIITLSCQWHYAVNRKYDKMRKDIDMMLEVCSVKPTRLRYMLEYRVFSYQLMQKISEILLEKNINTIYISSGQYLDNIYDNLIAGAMINKNVPDIQIICTANIWHSDHIELLHKSEIYGQTVQSINSLELLS